MTTTTTAAPKGAAGRSKGTAKTNGKVNQVTVRGVKFLMPATVEARLMKHIDEDDTIAFLQDVLGEEQMEKFWAIEVSPPLRKGLEDLVTEAFTKIAAATGLTAGE